MSAPTTPVGSRYSGEPIRPREDPKFLTGRAQYVADIDRPGLLHAVFVRSPHPHAAITMVDATAARSAPGVVAVLTAGDFADLPGLPVTWIFPGTEGRAPEQPLLAGAVARYTGEPIALVIADHEYAAVDAASLVDIGYQPWPSVSDALAASLPDAAQLHPRTPGNTSFDRSFVTGDIDAVEVEADVVVNARIRNQRLAACPIEPRAVLAEYDPATDQTTLFTSTQGPHNLWTQIAEMLGIAEHRLRVVAPAVGGGFGAKLALYREDVALVVAARRLGRPIRWVETRSENLVAMTHGRDHVSDVTVSADRSGRILGLRVDCYANLGAYLSSMGQGVPGMNFAAMVGGNYRIPNISVRVRGMMTNTTPVDTYRGAGRPEATFLTERAVELVAEATGIDSTEIRRRNFFTKFPVRNATNVITYDSGDYHAAMDKLLAELNIPAERERQRRLRAEGRLLGVGVAAYVEFTGAGPSQIQRMMGFKRGGYDSAIARVHSDGRVTVFTGISSHGQSHHTTLAQIVAGRLRIPADDVEIVQSDTAITPPGAGTFNSRSMPVGASAVVTAADRVVAKARAVAASLLEANPDDIELGSDGFAVRGNPSTALSWKIVAREAFLGGLPGGVEPTLEAHATFDPAGVPCAFGVHGCVVEVDPDTGDARLDRVVAVDDCGTIINPVIATGQVHGGLAQGLGQALWELVDFGPDGRPGATSFQTYRVPRATDFPRFETHHTVTPSPLNPLGVKGVGESGTIGSTPAAYLAVLDAIAHLGVRNLDMPLTPEKVWRAMTGRPAR